jgi:hypothetical protein
MHRREVFAGLTAYTGGALLVPAAAAAQPCSGGCLAATAAEAAADVTPAATEFAEGDIRRYGAAAAAADNSKAIESALLVSANGGSAAFMPPGIWKILQPVNCPLSSSMYGMGQMSVIAPQGCDGLVFAAQPAYAGARFFRDFSILGARSGGNVAVAVRLAAAGGARVTGIQFSNLNIQNFATAVHLRGLWNSSFRDCFLYNNGTGYHFQGQNIQIRIDGGFIQLGAHAPTAGTYGVLVDSIAGESTQSLHMNAVGLYGFNTNIALVLALYTSIQNCDISASRSVGVQVVTVQGGTTLRDCWIQTNGSGPTTGVQIAARSSVAMDKVNVEGCTIICDVANSGSTGISVGRNQRGVSTNSNTIGTVTAPFALGIDNGGGRNHVAKFNTIFASKTALKFDSSSADCEVGPNTIQSGSPVEFNGDKPANFSYSQNAGN